MHTLPISCRIPFANPICLGLKRARLEAVMKMIQNKFPD